MTLAFLLSLGAYSQSPFEFSSKMVSPSCNMLVVKTLFHSLVTILTFLAGLAGLR